MKSLGYLPSRTGPSRTANRQELFWIVMEGLISNLTEILEMKCIIIGSGYGNLLWSITHAIIEL